MLSLVILSLAAVCVVLLILSMLLNPVQRSIGLGNVSRRVWSSAMVVAGSMVGTALIAGSLVLSDTSERTLQDAAFSHLGEIDITVMALDPVTFERLPLGSSMLDTLSRDGLREPTDDRVDGVLGVAEWDLPVVKIERDANSPDGFTPILAEPEVTVVGLNFAELDGFGSDQPYLATVGSLEPGHAYVSDSLAKELELTAGDSVAVYFENSPSIFEVAEVVRDEGISGRRLEIDETTGTVILPLGEARALMGLEDGQMNTVYVSLPGGVIDGAAATDAVGEQIHDLLEDVWPDPYWAVRHDKQNTLEEDGGGPSTGAIFLMVSSFAILAGVMLIINIYTMLAEERRTEMGIMRAVALKRQQLVMVFAYEGFVYSAVASVIGAIAGAALGALVVAGLSEVLAQDQNSTLDALPLTIKPATLVLSGAAGLLISFITAFVTSIRISRLNIVLAIRDLSEPASDKPGRWQLVAAPLALILGGLGAVFGFVSGNGYLQYIGPCVMLISGAAIIGRFVSPRLIFTIGGASIIAYSFLADRLEHVEKLIDEGPGLFMLSGIFMLLAGMMIIAFNLSLVLWAVRISASGLSKLEPIVCIAIAYPAINRARTSFTMGMFGLVIFGVTLITVYGGLLDGFVDANLEKAAGGFDVVIYNTRSNLIDDLESEFAASGKVTMGDIDAIMPVHRALVKFPDFERPLPDDEDAPEDIEDTYVIDSVHGVTSSFVERGEYPLEVKMDRFDSDAEAWAAVIADPSLAVVSSRYDGTNEHADNALLDPGDTVNLLNPETGEIVEKTVAARMEQIEINFGILWGVVVGAEAYRNDFSESSFRGDSPRLFVIELTEGADLTAAGKQIEKALVTTGARVIAVRDDLAEELSEISTFLRIFQGFLAFGLIVGIAGLAVIAARSVHQRRKGIGTLRALGFQPGMVLASMLIEWSFIALVGILLGTGLGLLGGYRLYALFVRESGGAFTVPWLEVIGVAALVYVASLAFTVFPALKASRMPPAEALRHQE